MPAFLLVQPVQARMRQQNFPSALKFLVRRSNSGLISAKRSQGGVQFPTGGDGDSFAQARERLESGNGLQGQQIR